MPELLPPVERRYFSGDARLRWRRQRRRAEGGRRCRAPWSYPRCSRRRETGRRPVPATTARPPAPNGRGSCTYERPSRTHAAAIRWGPAAQRSSPCSSAPGCEADRRAAPFRLTNSLTLGARSEEHTSELQSRVDLVCRLLLEKKKKIRSSSISLQKHLLNITLL